MIAIEFRFPGGHFHATPWGHHVNEGLVEWPPSPWRLTRALMATGFTKLGWTQVPTAGRILFERLASALPSYTIPPATLAHARHYMPLGGSADKTTLVIDAWANVGQGVLTARWPVELPPDARVLLEQLVEHLGYLGRAESWVDARLAHDVADVTRGSVVEPVSPSDPSVRRGLEQVPLLAPVAAEHYHSWREAELTRLPAAGKTSAQAPYPADLIACLGVETAWLREHGWSQPPGSRVALYWRRSDALATVVAPPRDAGRSATRTEAMLLALATPSRNTHALPSIERAMPQAELLHEAAVSKLGRGWVPELVGKDADGHPLGGHRHAHIVALDLDEDAHVDHLLVWAPGGLGDEAQRALRAVRRTYAKNVSELSLAVVGTGDLESFSSIGDRLGQPLRRMIAPARVWISRTPFVAPRFVKPRGPNTIVGQVRAELESRGFQPSEVEVVEADTERESSAARGRFRHFVMSRRKGDGPPQTVAWRIRLTFDLPVRGLISLGYGCHFGLGSFEAVE